MKTKKFFEDYWALCKQTGQFYKDHWFGTLVVSAIGSAISTAPIWVPVVKEKIEDRKLSNYQKEES